MKVKVSGAKKLLEMRSGMVAWTTAMKKALARIPGAGSSPTLYDIADAIATSPLIPVEARIAWGASQFIRNHPDIAQWAPTLIDTHGSLRGKDLSSKVDLIVDALFILAMAIDRMDPEIEILSKVEKVKELMEITDG